MKHGSKERNKWKVRIANSINQCRNLVKRPVRKLMAEIVSGILRVVHCSYPKSAEALRNQPAYITP